MHPGSLQERLKIMAFDYDVEPRPFGRDGRISRLFGRERRFSSNIDLIFNFEGLSGSTSLASRN
jgi:hypothetical protein